MTSLSQVKKKMLQEAVRENVDLLGGRRPEFRRARRSRWLGRILFAVVLPVALFVSINAISTGARGPEVLVVKGGPQAPAGPPASPGTAEPSLKPRTIEPSVFRLAVTRIVLDPGHGGADPGTHGFGLAEKDITLDVARRAATALRDEGFEVVLTRTDDSALSLRERASLANQARGDLFVSIHVNSIPLPERRGVETYWLGPSDDPFVHELAGAENRESGYSLSDFRKMLEGVYAGVRQVESRRLAESVHASIVGATRRVDAAREDRGVKSAPFVVLVATEMPGILAEVACLSNSDDARLLGEPASRETIARAIALGLRRYADAELGGPKRPAAPREAGPAAPPGPAIPAAGLSTTKETGRKGS